MFTLVESRDYWIMLAIVAGFGGFGGLVYDLLQARAGNSGMLELLGRRERNRYFDLGTIASILVGAAAAIAVLYIFPPTITIEEGGTATTQYDLVAVISLSVIVGSAGPSVLEIAQQRIKAAMSAQEARTKETEGQIQIEQVGNVIAKAETENALREALTKVVVPQLDQALVTDPQLQPEARSEQLEQRQKVVEDTIKVAMESFEPRMEKAVDTAKKALSTPMGRSS
jgi:hypothetical protein